jgi:serine/threonine protein kinase
MKRKRIENFVIYINEELGKGSFGKVYKGLNEITKQPVAIKALPKKMSRPICYVVDHD